MNPTVEVKVPDIGDFKNILVIEVLVKPGDTVKVEQSLITVDSDKASMEIPSSQAGVVKEIKVKLGDKVKQGSLVLMLDSTSTISPSGQSGSPPPQPSPFPVEGSKVSAATVENQAVTPVDTAQEAPKSVAPTGASYAGTVDMECDLLVLGAGPGGYSAAFRAAAVMDEVSHLGALGARLDVVEMLDGLMQGADRDLVKIWQKMNAKRFDNIMLKTKTVSARALPEGIEVTFAAAEEGDDKSVFSEYF